MGDIADMMLDGTLCECCGTYIDEDGDGIPRYCSKACAKDRNALESHPNQLYKPSAPKVSCPACKRRVKGNGLADHMRDAHGGQSAMAYKVIQNPALIDELVAALKAQHQAADWLLARLIEIDPKFMPTESPVWPKLHAAAEALKKAGAL